MDTLLDLAGRSRPRDWPTVVTEPPMGARTCKEPRGRGVSKKPRRAWVFWRARRDLNPRPLAPQANALSAELRARGTCGRRGGRRPCVFYQGAGRPAYPALGSVSQTPKTFCCGSVSSANQPILGTGVLARTTLAPSDCALRTVSSTDDTFT